MFEGVRLTAQRFGHLNLRGNGADAAFVRAVERHMGLPLPLHPNSATAHGSAAALWLGPDEWLLLTAPGNETLVADGIRGTCEGMFFAITNITDGQAIMRLSGPHARDVLAKGCSVDLHPRAFGPGRCAQTTVAKVGVTIRLVDESPMFDLILRRSFADYFTGWLNDAGTEFGLAAR